MKIKVFLGTALLLFCSSICFGQIETKNEVKKQSPFDQSCECISEIDRSLSREAQFEAVRQCIKSALTSDQLLTGLQEIMDQVSDTLKKNMPKNDIDTIFVKTDSVPSFLVLDPTKGYDELERSLIDDCGAMNSLLNDTAGISSVNSISSDPKALDAYNKGLEFYNKEDFKQALKYYEKAVKIDKRFAFAWDMVGITYRRLGAYKEAVKAYKKSLRIDPRGQMPLQNLPIAYRMLDKWEKAADYYRELIRYYPDSPEGYFGLGQCGAVLEDYEMALDNMMTAYLKYQNTGSPYVNDANAMLSQLYQKLSADGNDELFMKYALKHGIEINKD